jgi:hypothetical protein
MGSYVVNHPGDFFGSMIDFKDLSQGNYAKWAGHLAPSIALTIATAGGVGAIAKGAEAAGLAAEGAEAAGEAGVAAGEAAGEAGVAAGEAGAAKAAETAGEGAGDAAAGAEKAAAESGSGAGQASASDAASSAEGASSQGGMAPVMKGQEGVEKSVAAAEARGETIIGREITMDTSAARTRIDLLSQDQEGNLKFIEAKNGPNAGLTPNQEAAYPLIREEGGVPAGANAARAGLTPGLPTGPIPIQVDWW